MIKKIRKVTLYFIEKEQIKKVYSQTSEARTQESSITTENSNKNLGPDKNCS